MTTQLPSKVRLAQIASFTKSMALPPSHDEIEAMARALLAGIEQEPVAYMYRDNLHTDARFSLEPRLNNWSPEDISEYEISETPLYTHPAPVPAAQDAVSKLLNILDRHTVDSGWCEPPISLAELVIARDGREELDTIRVMLNGGKS